MSDSKFYKINFTQEQRIINRLMFETEFMPEIGLLNGKMGIVLTFAHLHRHYGNPIYDEMAEYILDSLIKNIYVTTSIDFATGLAGIVWGIEYLIENKFIEGNSLKICKHIDRLIMEKDPRRIKNISLEYGLEGLLHYVLAHLSFRKDKGNIQPFDKTYLNDLLTATNSIEQKKNIRPNFYCLTEQLNNYLSNKIWDYKFDIQQFIKPIKYDNISDIPLSCFGIRNGIAANLLRTIL